MEEEIKALRELVQSQKYTIELKNAEIDKLKRILAVIREALNMSRQGPIL